MAPDRFFEDGTRLLTSNAFDFVLDAELKRAARSQNFFTLVMLEARREWDGLTVDADRGTLGDVAGVVGDEIRDTDLLGLPDNGMLALVLLDADYESSKKVIDRVVQRIDSYDFPAPLRISMGAACYPTHAVDSTSLKREAMTHPVVSWRSNASGSRLN